MGAVITGGNDANQSCQYFSSMIYFWIFIIAVAGAQYYGVFKYALFAGGPCKLCDLNLFIYLFWTLNRPLLLMMNSNTIVVVIVIINY